MSVSYLSPLLCSPRILGLADRLCENDGDDGDGGDHGRHVYVSSRDCVSYWIPDVGYCDVCDCYFRRCLDPCVSAPDHDIVLTV